ncbi:MAG: hypothetical protein LQ352_005570, partial [Teloschistes flavicans]
MAYDFAGRRPAIPLNSLMIVTGISGYIGSYVADQLLLSGHRVRGTVRTPEKGQWVRDSFGTKYDAGKSETAIISDMASPGTFDEVCK